MMAQLTDKEQEAIKKIAQAADALGWCILLHSDEETENVIGISVGDEILIDILKKEADSFEEEDEDQSH